MRFAWLARNTLYVKDGDAPPVEVKSQFAENARKKAADSAQRNAWKTQNQGALFMGMGLRDQGALQHELPAFLTGLSASPSGELLYSLELRDVAGVFEVSRDGATEKRLYHGNQGGLRDLRRHPLAPIVAASTPNVRAGTSHLCLVGLDGEGVTEVTEGDTVDRHPSWVPGEPRTLVFESAGVGRTPDGLFGGLAPSTIAKLDVKTGALQTLVEAPDTDCCQPHLTEDGALFYLRRPHATLARGPSFGEFLLSVLLFPWRLLQAVLGWFNFFSLRYSGKPLLGGRDARAQEADIRRLMLWGNLAQAQQESLAQVQEQDLKAVRAPASWELVRRKGGADEVLERGVATFHLCPDGALLFTDGVDLKLRTPDGQTRTLHSDSMVQAVVRLAD